MNSTTGSEDVRRHTAYESALHQRRISALRGPPQEIKILLHLHLHPLVHALHYSLETKLCLFGGPLRCEL
jgi:hypothetical protein